MGWCEWYCFNHQIFHKVDDDINALDDPSWCPDINQEMNGTRTNRNNVTFRDRLRISTFPKLWQMTPRGTGRDLVWSGTRHLYEKDVV